jgi:hypothetical protein
MTTKLAFTAFLLLALSLPAYADAIADGVAAIPGVVEDVRITGNWEKAGKSGTYRVIVARTGGEAITARLFVQWVVFLPDGSAAVEQSVEIKELGELKVDIADYNSEADDQGLSIFLETLGADAGAAPDAPTEGYELHIFSPTDYRFGPATN